MRRQYPFHLIEPKWQQFWEKQQSFRAFNPGEEIPVNHPFAHRHKVSGNVAATQLPPKFYILDMFPYPSGAGLHVGHPEGYTATDILSRYRRAKGFNVLHPMGWDAFGLPAEQYAIKTGQHPRKTTEENIANFKRQIKSLGFSYDWSREVDTTDPKYFKWTQWIFLKLYNSWFNPETNKAEPIETLEYPAELQSAASVSLADSDRQQDAGSTLEQKRREFRDNKRLAYIAEAPVNWCEELGTVLANEEVIDGKSEVGGFPVVRKPMRQWMLRITAYAERLLNDLEGIDWSHSLKEMQRNWIGRSEGASVEFKVQSSKFKVEVFTTRPDTLFGATYMVLSPEHRLVDEIVPETWPEGTPASWKGIGNDRILMPNSSSPTLNSSTPTLNSSAPTPNSSAPTPNGSAHTPNGSTSTSNGSAPESNSSDTTSNSLSFVEQSLSPKAAIAKYRAFASGKSDLERTELAKDKTGVFTGAYAINPVNGEKIPIWIADYVLATYGTGAIMAVPAHDERDWEFAKKYSLSINIVVLPPPSPGHGAFDPSTYTEPFCDEGICFQSPKGKIASVNKQVVDIYPENQPNINGLATPEAKKKIIDWLESKGLGKKTVNFKLRDWLFSRQRFWGEPFPIIWKRDVDGNLYHEALPESALPVVPPELTDYKPAPGGEPPLARAKDWVNEIPGAQRETNTMPQWAGSCWYYLRYLDAQNSQGFVGKDAENYWMGADASSKFNVQSSKSDVARANFEPETLNFKFSPTPGVDLYVGGTEHAVLHLLYARFWHKVLFDLGYVSKPEPFFKLVNQGLILGEDGQKMSKSRGNVVNPDDITGEFGADAFRLYEMFMGPLEMVKPWNTNGVSGVYKFLGRVWRLFVDEKSETEFEQAEATAEMQSRGELLERIELSAALKNVDATPAQLKTLHACIKKVTDDLDGMRFNTAISAMMVFVNDAIAWETKPVSVLRDFLILLAPFAPHLSEELWAKLSAASNQPSASLGYAAWPKYDPTLLVEDTLEIPVQVNGKLRDRLVIAADATDEQIKTAALASEKLKPFIEGKEIKKIVIVPKKLVNIVAI